MATELSATEKVEVPKAALREMAGAQIQVLMSSSKEGVGTQTQEPEVVVSFPSIISSSCLHSIVVHDINGLSSSVLANLGTIFGIGP